MNRQRRDFLEIITNIAVGAAGGVVLIVIGIVLGLLGILPLRAFV